MTTQGGFGTIVRIKITSTLTVIAKAIEIEFPEFEKLLAEVTAHDSPGGYAEHIASGKRKMNSFTIKLLWDIGQATHAAVLAAFNSDATVDMQVQDPDGTEMIAFAAHVYKVGRITTQDDGYTCDVAIQPTGIPTFSS